MVTPFRIQSPSPIRTRTTAVRTRPRGSSSRGTAKQAAQAIREVMQPATVKLQPVEKLLGTQTSSFTLKSLAVAAGAAAGDAHHIPIVGDDGVTYYIDVLTALA